MVKIAEACVPFPMTMSVYETFYCLNILPAGSDLSAKPPSG
jgi:hypothetical protein